MKTISKSKMKNDTNKFMSIAESKKISSNSWTVGDLLTALYDNTLSKLTKRQWRWQILVPQ